MASLFLYSSKQNKNKIPFYFIQSKLNNIKITSISEPVSVGNVMKFNLEGLYLKYSKSKNEIIVLPHLRLLEYPKLFTNNSPILIKYPTTIQSDIKIKSDLASVQKEEFKKFGNKAFNFMFKIHNNQGNYTVSEELILNTSHIGSNELEIWNEFVEQVEVLNNQKIIYE